MELFPAMDLRQGRVIRLLHGNDAKRTVYREDPLALLDEYRGSGARWVHVVDLDAAFGEPPQVVLLSRLAEAARGAGLSLQVGGGLRDEASVERALDAGFERGVVGSMVARQPELFGHLCARFPGRLVPALDIAGGRDELRVAGWTEAAPIPVEAACRQLHGLGCPAVLVTDVDRDGALEGPNLPLTRRIAAASGKPALVSGGVRALDDLRQAARHPEIAGAIVGRALFEGLFSVEEALAACRTDHEEESR